MTRNDPAYEYFLADAKARGYPSSCDNPDHRRPRRSCPDCKLLDDYFREIGIDPPVDYKNHQRVTRASMEVPQHDDLERIASSPTWTSRYSIYKSWGESGPTISITRNSHDGDGDD